MVPVGRAYEEANDFRSELRLNSLAGSPIGAIPSQRNAPEGSSSAIKSILFHVHEDRGIETRVRSAVALARACSAHVHLLQITPVDAYSMVGLFAGGPVGNDIIAAVDNVNATFVARLERRFERECVSWTSERLVAGVVPEVVKRAALSDILFIGREEAETEFSRSGPSLLNRLVAKVRSPIFIPGSDSVPFDPFGTAIIAWNGSCEAACAIRQSTGLIRLATDVRVVRVAAREEGMLPDTNVMQYLSRHGIRATMEKLSMSDEVGDTLIDYGRAATAPYFVLGAYSHSRAGEFLFGGVTRHLLGECPISLVAAH